MNKDTKKIFEAYSLLNEISRRDMELVKYDRPVEDLPFDNIFGNKLRIVFPISLGESTDSFFDSLIFNIEGTINHPKFKAKFPNILKFVRFDYKTKKAIVRIQTQVGEKDREETLASLVDKMFKVELLSKEYRDKAIKWIEQNVSQLLPSSYVVLSRSVIDNLRMSDISGIESCHSPGGGYYGSCLSEAAGGGVIAFVIDGGELKKRQIENIETDEEIFSDKDRSVEGLEATYRLRMRKYYAGDNGDEDGEEVGYFVLPETKVYKKSTYKGTGNSVRVPGLVEIILDFLKTKQNLNKDVILKLFKSKDIVRKGGSYEDTGDSYLFNQYFGGEDFGGSIPYEEEESLDDEESEQNQNERRYEQFSEELSDFLLQSGVRESKRADSSYQTEMTDEGHVYYYAYGGITIDVDEIDLVDDYDGTDDELEDIELDQLNTTISGNTKNKWDKVTDIKTKYYRVLMSELKKAGVDEDEIRAFRYAGNGYTIYMDAFLSDYNYEDGQTSDDVDNYPPFLRTLMEWDGKYKQIESAVIRALSIAGYADLTENQKIQYGLADHDDTKKEFSYNHYGSIQHKFVPKNLKFEGGWATFIVQTGINPTYLYNLDFNAWNSQDRNIKTKIQEDIKTAIALYIQDKLSIHYNEYEDEWKKDADQKNFKFENYNFDLHLAMHDRNNRWVHLKMTLEDATKRTNPDSINETPSGLTYKVSFEAETHNTLAIQGIDTGIDDVRNIIRGCLLKNIVPQEKLTSYDRNILRTYSIYLNPRGN